MPVGEVKSGQTASFALKKIKRSQIRKGMVMVSPKVNPQACWEFNADIMVSYFTFKSFLRLVIFRTL